MKPSASDASLPAISPVDQNANPSLDGLSISDAATTSNGELHSRAEQLITSREYRWRDPSAFAFERKALFCAAHESSPGMIGPDPIVEELGRAPLPTSYGDWSYIVFGDRTTGNHAAALVLGDIQNPTWNPNASVPVRIHSSNSVSELFLARDCGCTSKLEGVLKEFNAAGAPAVIIFLDHDGCGNGMLGFLSQLNHRYRWNHDKIELVDTSNEMPSVIIDQRDFSVAHRILRHLNISNPNLVTSNPEKLRQFSQSHLKEVVLKDASPMRSSPETSTSNNVMEMLHELDQEWRKLWECIDSNKQLLNIAGKPLILRLGSAPLRTEFGDWTIVAYGDYSSGEIHLALSYGELRDTLDSEKVYPVRVHSSCQTNERFHAINCECRRELHETMKQIYKVGEGVIVYLQQEGRGTGVFGKLHQLSAMFEFTDQGIRQRTNDNGPVTTTAGYRLHGFPDEIRDFTVGSEMLLDLGVSRVILYSNNPRKRAAIEAAGIEVTDTRELVFPDLVAFNPILLHDLRDKMNTLGHTLGSYFQHDPVAPNDPGDPESLLLDHDDS